ncbi:hypothetical protein MRB53_041215 [Persea americana]|nr:hypothetical protein MRB53_041215 [Persea americana]
MSLTLCTELNPRGSLQDFLSIAGSIQISRARQFSIDLLEALEEYHRHGITHGSIACTNIDIAGSSTMVLKLTDGGFVKYLNSDSSLPKKWLPPEDATNSSISLAKKADIWSLGVVIIQMSLGLDATSQYSSPLALFGKAILSDSFEDFVSRMCHIDNKKRPSAFDLLAVEFLRSNEPALADSSVEDKHLMKISSRSPVRSRSRHGSIMAPELPSRYAQDFTEIGRLGKGGFGEVVKARNKLDGGIYAIKKIVRAPQLDQILSEVMLLNRLNHPYVVRYYSTWVEETVQQNTDESSSITETITEDQELDFGLPSTGGLDFVSSSGYPLIEFGVDSDSDDSSVSSNEEQPLNGRRLQQLSSNDQSVLRLRKMRSASRKMQSTLYIQMEFCERRTMRDLIRKGLEEDNCWRFIRQITEGLAHVHSHGIIHRDLKPDNIFMDVAGNPKIGDFGLATTQQYHISDRSQTLSSNASVDMTMSIGTAMYIAPELGASQGSSYNEKVDMYSLGIIFYEMCEPFATSMERIKALQEVRKKDHTLPEQFQPPNGLKLMQGKVISCLMAHKPSERPTSLELLRTGLLPVKIEDETIRQALSSLADPRSPNHQKMMSALFAHDQAAENQVKAMAWDAKDQTSFDEPLKLRMKAIARDALISVFKLHGAEEVYRNQIFPRSTHYTATNVFQLLDASGNLLQLPYDLTFPLARKLAHSHQTTRCTFAFGQVFRDTFAGGPPTTNEEVDFDIVTGSNGSDLSFDDAEVLKALDDIVTDPALMLNVDATCFHINHTAVLDAILHYCRIPLPQYAAVKECISKLGFRQFTWAKIRNELRSHAIGLSITAVDDLEQFDFRDVPEKALAKIREIIQTSEVPHSFDDGVSHLLNVVRRAQNLKLSRKIWLAPLSCFNAKFYDDGILLQCVHQRKTSRDVLAAGGRYTSLVRACGRANASDQSQGVVGMSIGFDRLVAHMLKQAKAESKSAFTKDKSDELTLQKRCEVCIRIGLGDAVKDAGIRLLAALWRGNISAELVREDHVASMHEHVFNVILRHEASTTVKVRNLESESPEVDIPISSLIAHLHQELRERQVSKRRQPILGRQRSQNTIERRGNVQVLMSQHRSKKSNKYSIVEAAQQRWAERLDQWKDAPILAIETRDDVIELLRDTRLNDGESWKKALHTVPPNERQYLQQVQELLISWRKRWQEEDQMREACIFNFRTGHGIYYDLGL